MRRRYWTLVGLLALPPGCSGVIDAGHAHASLGEAGVTGGGPPVGTGGSDGSAPTRRDASTGSGGESGGPPEEDGALLDDADLGWENDAEPLAGDGPLVGPEIQPDCPGDPTAGWTEYADTFKVQFPYDLKLADRYSSENGIDTFWIQSGDKPFEMNNTTAPRTEARWSSFTEGQHMWTGDVLVDSPATKVAIFQIHTTGDGAGPVYLRVMQGDLEELGGQSVAQGIYGKWINLKVAFDAKTADATIWVNNCEKLQLKNSRPGTRINYFKHGVYTCDVATCRDHYKNIRLYQR